MVRGGREDNTGGGMELVGGKSSERPVLGLEGLGRAWAQRPLALACLGLALGLLLGRGLPVHAGAAWATAGLALAAAARCLEGRARRWLGLALALAGLAAGLARIQPLARSLDAALQPAQRALRLQARVVEDEGLQADSGLRRLRLDQAQTQPVGGGPWSALDGQLRASVDPQASVGWASGDRIQLCGDLHGFDPASGPGQMDLRAYLMGRGIAWGFSPRQGWPQQRLAPGPRWTLRKSLAAWRAWLGQGLAAGLDGAELGLARASLFGDKAGLARDEAQDFARAGFADVLVLSGTHFALALALWMLLAGRLTLWRRRRAWLGLAFAAAYAAASGFEPPVCRALALVGVWLLARALDLECEAPLSLAFGAILILLIQPGALWEAGFQLSFGACLSLVCLGPFLAARLPSRWPAWLRHLAGAQLALQWALLPLLAYHFHVISWPGLLGGLLAVLAIAVVLALGLPLAALGGRAPGAAWLLGGLLHQVLRFLAWAAQTVTHWHGALFAAGAPSYLMVLGFLAWALACLAYGGAYRRHGLAVSALALLAWLLWPGLAWAHRHPAETRLWMLDVGQGDSLLLEFGDGRTLLMDAGPARPDAGAWSVVPAIRVLGIQRLDWAAASHADADHVGGLATVLEQVPCDALLWNGQASQEPRWLEARAMARLKRLPLRSLRAGQHGPDDGPWVVLNPLPPRRRSRPAKHPDTNRASLVLRVEDWLMLTGDLPKPTERRLERLGLARPVEVLKVGHHGSRSATSQGWARALHPQEALISCGARNSFGHPSAQALAALARVHARLWRTDLQGCVALRWRAGRALEIQPWFQADPAALARPRGREASPWRGQDAGPEEPELALTNPADFH